MKISNEISGKGFNLNEDEKTIIIIAALLHDICKYEDNKEHNILGAKYIQDITDDEMFKTSKKDKRILSEIIKYHKGGKPKDIDNDKTLLLCKIVHDADKISKIFKKKYWAGKDKKY